MLFLLVDCFLSESEPDIVSGPLAAVVLCVVCLVKVQNSESLNM